MMHTKFLFNHDFDHPPQEEEIITYDQDTFDRACREHYIEGLDEGKRKALQSIDEGCRVLLPDLIERLAQTQSLLNHVSGNTSIIAASVLDALFPAFYDEAVFQQIRACIDDVVKHVMKQTQLTILCAPHIVAKLNAYYTDYAVEHDIRICIQGRDDFKGSDLNVQWEGGLMTRHESCIKESIQTILDAYKQKLCARNDTDKGVSDDQ